MEVWIQNAIGYDAWKEGVISSLAEEGLISPIKGIGTVNVSQDTVANVRPTPSTDKDRVTTMRRGEQVLVIGASEPDNEDKRWMAVWVNGVHWMYESTLDVTWYDQGPMKEMDEAKSEQWFPKLSMLLAGR